MNRLISHSRKVLAMPEFREKFITGVGLDVNYLATERFAEFLNAERLRMADKVKGLDVLLD